MSVVEMQQTSSFIYCILHTCSTYLRECKMIDKEDNLIKIATEEGDNIFFEILKNHPELDKNDPRQTAIIFSIMTNCIVQLYGRGWTERELINEVFDHCAIAREILDEDE